MNDQSYLPGDLDIAATATQLVVGKGHEFAMSRRDDGVWCYDGTNIPVPGAVDQTLGEIANVREVTRRGQGPEAVLVACSEIDANPDLSWVPKAGRRLRGEDEDEYEVPWPVWQERAVAPVGVRAPERDADGLRRLLAVEERALRFARRQLEVLTEKRARSVAIASGLGMTRREVSDLLGLSTGRVQQVIEDAPATLRTEVDDVLRDFLLVLRDIGPRVVNRDDVAFPAGSDDGLLDELIAFGLVEQQGSQVQVTDAGQRAELHLRTRKRKGGGGRG
jgi:hypothetical protein